MKEAIDNLETEIIEKLRHILNIDHKKPIQKQDKAIEMDILIPL